jgi:hypothetical protein
MLSNVICWVVAITLALGLLVSGLFIALIINFFWYVVGFVFLVAFIASGLKELSNKKPP